MQSTFRCKINKQSPGEASEVRPTFGSFSIITEELATHEEIDCDDVCEQEECEEPGDSHLAGSRALPTPGPLKGYDYTPFEPRDEPRTRPGHLHTSPTQHDASIALKDLQSFVHPKRKTGPGYKDPDLDLWRRARLEGMMSMLYMYTNRESKTYNCWAASSCQAAIGMGRGRHCAGRL
jgi:hypothetical protein